jgi:hypothetical protein
MSNWNDFNDAEQQQSFDLIPRNTAAKLRLSIKPGGFDDPSQGWTGGWATQSFETGAVYLACRRGDGACLPNANLVERRSVQRKDPLGEHGRTFRAALNSARNVYPADNSPQAQAARRISGFADLDGLEFAARIDIEKDGRGEDRNTIKAAIEPDHKDYGLVMGVMPKGSSGGGQSGVPAAVAAPSYTPPVAHTPSSRPAPSTVPSGKPAWAQ